MTQQIYPIPLWHKYTSFLVKGSVPVCLYVKDLQIEQHLINLKTQAIVHCNKV